MRHLLNFTRDWPDAKTIRLEENYRSTHQILSWANRLIAFNTYRHDKRLRSTVQGVAPRIIQCKSGEVEAKRIVAEIKRRLAESKRQPRDFAILFRTNDQPRAFEMEPARRIFLFYLRRSIVLDRKEVKGVISYLKILLHSYDDVALLRVSTLLAGSDRQPLQNFESMRRRTKLRCGLRSILLLPYTKASASDLVKDHLLYKTIHSLDA